MKKEYANARDVLPPSLLRQVQAHWQGLLWIPVRERRPRKTRADAARDRRIVRDHLRGRPTAELAEEFALSQERIRQIVRKAKRRG